MSNRISVELMEDRELLVPAIPHASVEDREEYFNTRLLDKINCEVKSAWAVRFEETGFDIRPVYKAYIYVKDLNDYTTILGEIYALTDVQLEKAYMIDYTEWVLV